MIRRLLTPISVDEVACAGCPIGRVAGEGRGQFCPFIIRRHARGDLLCHAGDPVGRVWFVKRGVVGLSSRPCDRGPRESEAVFLPGSAIGLECLSGQRYRRTARVLSDALLCSATRDGLHLWMRQQGERMAALMAEE